MSNSNGNKGWGFYLTGEVKLEEIYFDEKDKTCKTLDGQVVHPIVKSPLIAFQTDDDFEVNSEIYDTDDDFNKRKEYVKERKDLHADIELGNLVSFHLAKREEVNAYMLCRHAVLFTMTLSYPSGHQSQGTNAVAIQFYRI